MTDDAVTVTFTVTGFERIEGHWLGAVGTNASVTAAVQLVCVAVSLYIGYPEFPMAPLLAINIAVAMARKGLDAERSNWREAAQRQHVVETLAERWQGEEARTEQMG